MKVVNGQPEQTMTYREAIREALVDALREDSRVLTLGEDIGRAGGSFKATVGLYEEFGGNRVIDTPISETGFTGAALGMAITGLRPVVEIMFADFLLVTMDQVVNSIAKYRYTTGGQTAVPLVIRAVGGGGLHFGSQHSATGESWLIPFAGLKVVCPSNPADAYQFLRWAIRDNNPVVVIEHKALYDLKGPISRVASFASPRPAVVRQGKDVTVVASLAMVSLALQAANLLDKQAIDAEVIDIRILRPINVEPIVASVRKTNQLVLVAEEPTVGGWMGTVATEVVSRAFDYIDRPPVVVGLPDTPIPFSPEELAIPSAEVIASRIKQALES